MAEHLDQTVNDFARKGINVQTCRVLLSLYHHGLLRPGILAFLVGLEQTAMSHLLKGMTRRGLIDRERDKQDNRAVDICLTPKGRRLAFYCHETALKQEQLLLKNLSRKEIDALRGIVWKMDENIRGNQILKIIKSGQERSRRCEAHAVARPGTGADIEYSAYRRKGLSYRRPSRRRKR